MSKRRLAYLAIPAAALAGVWLSTSRAQPRWRGQGPSEVIFPAQQLPIAFSHVAHLERDKLNCDFCHEDAPDSTSSLDNNIPREEQCAICHEIDRSQPTKQVEEGQPRADCELCHPGYTQLGGRVFRVVIPPPNLKFNHKAHVDKKIRCQFCHGELAAEKVGLATREQLPRMRLCLGCHDDRQAPSRCTTCHLAEAGGFVKLDYEQGKLAPSGVLRGDAHDLNFRMDHARVAKDDERYCGNCHRKEYCVSCHNGSVKPMDFHGNDYVSLHTIDARRNQPDCSACHRLQTFCVGCHSRSGVTLEREPINDFKGPFDTLHDHERYDSSATLNRRFHPPGWVEGGQVLVFGRDRDPNHHSFQAQRNIKQCASCHREQFCTECHAPNLQRDSSGQLEWANAINPHGPGWRNSRRCESLAASASRMCLRCHIDASQARCDWCGEQNSRDPACF